MADAEADARRGARSDSADKPSARHSKHSEDEGAGSEIDTAAVPSAVKKLIQKMDAKIDTKFNLILKTLEQQKRSRSPQRSPPRRRREETSDEEPVTSDADSHPVKKRAKRSTESDHDNPDVLIVQEEGEIVDLEEKLCRPKAKQTAANANNDAQPSTSGTDILRSVEQTFDTDEKTGEGVEDDLARLVCGKFNEKQAAKAIQQRVDSLPRPDNCSALMVPRVNSVIWKRLPDALQKRDLAGAATQRQIVKATVAVTQLANDLLREQNSGKSGMSHSDRVKCCTNAIALLGASSRDVSLSRRWNLRNHIGSLYRFCEDTDTLPITDQLFGSDLSASFRQAREMDKLSAAVGQHDNRSFGAANGKKAFLWKGKGKQGQGQQQNQFSQNKSFKKGHKNKRFNNYYQ